MADQRLPIVDGDDGQWGDVLNQFLEKEHYNTGGNDAANGGHKNVTLRPGTTAAGTAPLKFTSGPLTTAAEAGAVEFNSDKLYFTQTTGATRKVVAAFDDSSGATGDVYYRNSGGDFVRLPIGSSNEVLTVVSGAPSWETSPSGFTTSVVGLTVDGGGSVITTGSKGYRHIQEDCIITGWTIVGKESGSCVVDIKKCTYSSFPTTATIAGTEKPTLSSAQKNQDSTLTTWTTSLTAGDILEFVVDSASTVTRINLFIHISK